MLVFLHSLPVFLHDLDVEAFTQQLAQLLFQLLREYFYVKVITENKQSVETHVHSKRTRIMLSFSRCCCVNMLGLCSVREMHIAPFTTVLKRRNGMPRQHQTNQTFSPPMIGLCNHITPTQITHLGLTAVGYVPSLGSSSRNVGYPIRGHEVIRPDIPIVSTNCLTRTLRACEIKGTGCRRQTIRR